MTRRTRYALVGTGARSGMYRRAILGRFNETAELVGLCDINPGRLQLAVEHARDEYGVKCPGYAAEDFDRMIEETRPQAVVVTTRDGFHDQYICRAMELGCDAITEKPMTTDAEKCRRILDTKARTGRALQVTFNYRYSPPRSQVKDLLMSGLIGEVLSVEFQWMLNNRHGADYMRRWHRNKQNSGGLMVHKATHHFDLVNWWLSTVPERVYASGHRRFYTPATAERFGLTRRGERCHGCPEMEKCPFSLDLAAKPSLKSMYLNCEKYDGYFRDRCVFSANTDIEDCMNVIVDYRNGVKMNYALNNFLPWEGYHVAFNGTLGRLEHRCEESVYISGDGTVPGALQKEGTWTRVYPQWQPAYEVDLWTGAGGHGGADPVMLGHLLDPENQPKDKYLRAADERAGAWSIMTGVAANHSMHTGQPVRIADLVGPIGNPDYPPMPTDTDPLPILQA